MHGAPFFLLPLANKFRWLYLFPPPDWPHSQARRPGALAHLCEHFPMEISMLKTALSAWMLAGLSIVNAQAAENIGFREIDLAQSAENRALHVALWYPTASTEPVVSTGENQVFFGGPAILDAPVTGQAHPLVVLSHGYRGNWRNLSWLATELVRQGYVVAAPNHPGTTSFDTRPEEAARLWERPRDLSRVIDHLTQNPALAGPVQGDRIAAIGHSLGGWTVTALAGARYSAQRLREECQLHPSPRICGLAPELGIAPEQQPLLGQDLRDPRVKAFVSLDLGFARGFTAQSLASIEQPILVMGAGVDINGDLPFQMESAHLIAQLPQDLVSSEKIADASHFSFMQKCKPGAVALLEKEAPGDEIICQDGDGRSREAIHRQVADRVSTFLAKAIPPQ